MTETHPTPESNTPSPAVEVSADTLPGVLRQILKVSQEILVAEELSELSQCVFHRAKLFDDMATFDVLGMSEAEQREVAPLVAELQALEPRIEAVLNKRMASLTGELHNIQQAKKVLSHYKANLPRGYRRTDEA